MFQIRIHGRGGQGVVTAAEILSVAAFLEGDHAQAFPSFGSERMGAPVIAFCRLDDKEIRLREPVMSPDALIVQDPTLLHQVDLFSGLDTRGYLLINTTRRYRDLGLGDYVTKFPPHHICTVAASEWAVEFIGKPLPNAAMLGAFSAITRRVKLDSVQEAIRQKFPGELGEKNAAAAGKAYNTIRTN
ncbi:MAG: 2-oxoacid:acceptor oxidoreductase family protein [Alphaproteobacteria bacterium]|nr:2-oxoacid:acceptor oxidoreductase family protein [Alphaproteobacteria bacterium]